MKEFSPQAMIKFARFEDLGLVCKVDAGVLHGNAPRLAFRAHDPTPRDISRGTVSRDVKVDLSKDVHGTFFATFSPEVAETLSYLLRSGHLRGCVRISCLQTARLALPRQ